jgi:hypothetical protein
MDRHNEAAKEGDFKFNLIGFIVGNGVTNWKWDGDQAYIQGAFPRQLSSINLDRQMKESNCDYYYEDNGKDDSPVCNELGSYFYGNTSDINPYDIYRNCWTVNQINNYRRFCYI